MKRYTIGILFNDTFTKVLLVEKQRPEWQRGRHNFPGGKFEPEDFSMGRKCIASEFKEETDLTIGEWDWKYIGKIENWNLEYEVSVLSAVYNQSQHGTPKSMTDEKIEWSDVHDLPLSCLSNVYWLMSFAINYHNQGNNDRLTFGTFKYV